MGIFFVKTATSPSTKQREPTLSNRATTTLPIVLNRDLGLIDHFRLQSTNDLVKITELAREREQWREFSARIEKATEAFQTMNWDATRQ